MNEEEQNKHYWEQLRKGDKQALFGLYNNIFYFLGFIITTGVK